MGGGFTPWLTWQGAVDISTRGGADNSLLTRKLDGHLALADSLRTAAQVHLASILSADEALRELGTFVFVTSHLLSTSRRHLSDVTELIYLI